MSFLFPLYLLGLSAIAIPILLHLRKRPPKEVFPFSSLMFLEKTSELTIQRKRIERWLLLLLRCLALCLLAFAFGRPFMQSLGTAEDGPAFDRIVILVDQSASLRREDLWQQATEAVERTLRASQAQDEVAIAYFDTEVDWATRLGEWRALSPQQRAADFLKAHTLREDRSPSWRATDLGEAITQGLGALAVAGADSPAREHRIVLVSDFQTGAALESLRQTAWPGDVTLQPIAVSPQAAGNLSLDLASTPPRAQVDEEETWRVRITNAADSDFQQVSLAWKDHPHTQIEAEVAPGTSRILRTPPKPDDADNATLILHGDAHAFDNEVHITRLQPRPLRLLFFQESGLVDSAGKPLFYLQKAIQPTPALAPILTLADTLDDEIDSHSIIITPGPWSPSTSQRLHQFAQDGGLVIAMPEPITATTEPSLHQLTGQSWKLTEAAVEDYALLSQIDFEHPVLAHFAKAQIRDFTSIRTWRHRHLELPSPLPASTRLLASFDNGSPAWVEQAVGQGSVFLLLSSLDSTESQLPLSSKFVPWLYSLFEHTGYSLQGPPTHYVGDGGMEAPGFHSTERDGSPLTIPVNLPPTEGRTLPFDPQVVFPQLGISLYDPSTLSDAPSTDRQKRHPSAQQESEQAWWRWLVAFALVLFLGESWLSSRRERVTA